MATEQTALITLFGATGDLASRKLYPALFNLYKKGEIKEHFALIGTGRREWDDDKFRSVVSDSVKGAADSDQQVSDFASHFYYKSHDVTNPEHYKVLKGVADQLDAKYDLKGNRIFYISLAPRFFSLVANNLKQQNVFSDNGFNRLIIEKPFGHDFESAQELNDSLSSAFDEDQVFRIDHYLGKEMVQNIAALRFGNPMIESVWNNKFIDNVQVTLAENMGVGERAGYYDTSGALRDMVQNHIMQILSLLAMDEPNKYKDVEIRAQKVKALQSLHIYDEDEVAKNFVRGQYGANGDQKDYRHEDNVPEDSNTETFVAGKLEFQNNRWAGVPFYVRTGKLLADKFARIDVVFKKPALDDFARANGTAPQLLPSVLTIKIEPDSGFEMQLNKKHVGQGYTTDSFKFTHDLTDSEMKEVPLPYERLINDAMKGDHTNFASWAEVAQAWKFVDQIEKFWNSKKADFPNYTPGTMGPKAAEELLTRSGRNWAFRAED
ncbi:glucose-6-phosphate dehydrogenase [Nicoliella spurrieriana]|uniref:Glucose-6-phosphate 1-dehydrogenase n=1 Tax=Nicoliella spurrieriana TaxID=2925830 RepID=A0A976X5R5_9LACO|nr:glucose-6-phosphate dehydrogenase [Nicoliella spurrieriana]UQS87180.1 glucose-6-phosphate dehydrogenase [Nicoliella spurrieriana]